MRLLVQSPRLRLPKVHLLVLMWRIPGSDRQLIHLRPHYFSPLHPFLLYVFSPSCSSSSFSSSSCSSKEVRTASLFFFFVYQRSPFVFYLFTSFSWRNSFIARITLRSLLRLTSMSSMSLSSSSVKIFSLRSSRMPLADLPASAVFLMSGCACLSCCDSSDFVLKINAVCFIFLSCFWRRSWGTLAHGRVLNVFVHTSCHICIPHPSYDAPQCV